MKSKLDGLMFEQLKDMVRIMEQAKASNGVDLCFDVESTGFDYCADEWSTYVFDIKHPCMTNQLGWVGNEDKWMLLDDTHPPLWDRKNEIVPLKPK